MRAADKRDYPELTDKAINWYSDHWRKGRTERVRVVGCDYHIGVTLVSVNDPNQYFHCMHGPLSPIGKKLQELGRFIGWDQTFECMLRGIQSGVVDADEVHQTSVQYVGPCDSNPSSATCSFNQ